MTAHSKDERLRECPFCGVIPEPPFQNLMDDEDDNIVSVFTMAHQCKQLGNTLWVSATEHDDVVAAWNRRSTSSAERGMREAAADALSGWRYIRKMHGDLPGVGWDRVEQALSAALSARAGEEEQEQATRGEDAATAPTDRL